MFIILFNFVLFRTLTQVLFLETFMNVLDCLCACQYLNLHIAAEISSTKFAVQISTVFTVTLLKAMADINLNDPLLKRFLELAIVLP